MGSGSTCDASNIFPAPNGGAALSWSVNGFTYTYTPSSTANPSAASGCAAPGVATFTFTAVPTDPTLDAYFVDDTLQLRHGVGTATASSAPLGQ
jgi:hypothetical protein